MALRVAPPSFLGGPVVISRDYPPSLCIPPLRYECLRCLSADWLYHDSVLPEVADFLGKHFSRVMFMAISATSDDSK